MGGIRVADARAGFRLAVLVVCVLGGLVLILLALNRPHPVQLPADWPLAELVPPPGAVAAQRPGWQGREANPPAPTPGQAVAGRRCWEIVFAGAFSWERLVEHTESILYPLGFEYAEPKLAGASGRIRVKMYMSPDRSLSVTVAHFKGTQSMLYESYDFYTYELVTY